MEEVIFYGAGRNAKDNIEKWIGAGIVPLCFVDNDILKQNKKFCSYDVLSLVDAIKKYPDCVFYITLIASNAIKAYDYLLKLGIDEKRIKMLDGTMQGMVSKKLDDTYANMYQMYSSLQDDLSRTLFWGRVKYSVSHNLCGIYESMIDKQNLEWLKNKTTYAFERYQLKGLWDLLKDNYPVQNQKIVLLGFDDEWNEYEWVVSRFLEAIELMGITIEHCHMPYNNIRKEYLGINCIDEDTLKEIVDKDTGIIIGIPGWCSQTKDLLDLFSDYRDIMYPIADTARPQYFEDFLKHDINEIFVDIGVFDFNNSIDFIKWSNNEWKKIYAFEPNKKQFIFSQNIIGRLADNDRVKIELISKGVGSVNSMMEFPEDYSGSGKSSEKTVSVEVVSLDSYLKGNPVSFIKMDIEGAEMDALLGMRETIRVHKPKLAICIYHKHEDIFEIMSYVLSIVPEYKCYIRHYNSNETETVLFCQV